MAPTSAVPPPRDPGALEAIQSLHIPKEELVSPAVAWPTLAVFAVSFWVWAKFQGLLWAGQIHPLAALIPLAVSTFVLFTPMHDAVHGAIATNASGLRWMNEIVGRLSALPYLAPYVAFRYVHLKHHKYTNDPDNDPDMWSGTGPMWMRLFKFCSQEHAYYVAYIPVVMSRPKWERIEAQVHLALLLGSLLLLVVGGYITMLFWAWFLPSRLAIGFLAFSFDYLPHRPHQERDRFKGTSVTSLYGTVTSPLTWPLLYQNYHNIHHLFPWLPFYRYADVWFAHRDKLLAAGTRVFTLFPIVPLARR